MLVLIVGFHHSNIKISEKWDDWILPYVTPSIHGTHHAIQRDTTLIIQLY